MKVVIRKADTLKEALDQLSKVIDNPIDPFTAMQELVQLQWQPGQDIGDYFLLVRRKAAHAGTTLKFVASMVSSQLPKEVQNRVKGTVTAVNEDLDHADAFKLVAEVKEGLTDKGFALNLGNKLCARRVATIGEKDKATYESELVEPQDSNDRVAFARSNPVWRKQSKGQGQGKRACYICGGRHFWKYCPDKRCPGCGQKGHLLKDCSTGYKGKDVHSISTANVEGLATELSVLMTAVPDRQL